MRPDKVVECKMSVIRPFASLGPFPSLPCRVAQGAHGSHPHRGFAIKAPYSVRMCTDYSVELPVQCSSQVPRTHARPRRLFFLFLQEAVPTLPPFPCHHLPHHSDWAAVKRTDCMEVGPHNQSWAQNVEARAHPIGCAWSSCLSIRLLPNSLGVPEAAVCGKRPTRLSGPSLG